MKKIILGIGTILVTTIPVITVVACGDNQGTRGNEQDGGFGLNDQQTRVANAKVEYETMLKNSNYTQQFKDTALNAIEWNDGMGRAPFIKEFGFKDMEIPSSFVLPSVVNQIGKSAFSGATFPDNYTIPSTVNYVIDDNAFEGAIIGDNFTMPTNVRTLHQELFSGADIKGSIVFPTNMTETPRLSFTHATLTNKFRLPNTITKVGDGTFEGTTLPDNFVIPSSVTVLGLLSFGEAVVSPNFTIPRNVVTDLRAFDRLSFKGDVSPDWYTYWMLKDGGMDIDHYTGTTQNPITVTKPSTPVSIDGYKLIPHQAFVNVTLDPSFVLPNSLEMISAASFMGASLPDNFVIPSNVKTIGLGAFENAIYKGQAVSITNPLIWLGHENQDISYIY